MKSKQIMINGKPTTPPAGAIAWKYADPAEEGRWLYDIREAADVASEDPGLVVWVPGPVLTAWANGGRSAGALPDIILVPTACENPQDALSLLAAACKEAPHECASGYLTVVWPEACIGWRHVMFSRRIENGAAVEHMEDLARLEQSMDPAANKREEDERDTIRPDLCLAWANCRFQASDCALCGGLLYSEQGPCIVRAVPDCLCHLVCDECAAQSNQGAAMMAVRDRFNESLAADSRPLDNIGRPLADLKAAMASAAPEVEEDETADRKAQAEEFILQNATPHCRTLREAAKYLQGKITPAEMPHPAIWNEVLKYAAGLSL